MNIHLTIDRLILDGITLDAGGVHSLQAAFESELTRLLAEGGLAPALGSGAALHSVRAGAVMLQPEGASGRLGGEIARAVYEGIGKSKRKRPGNGSKVRGI